MEAQVNYWERDKKGAGIIRSTFERDHGESFLSTKETIGRSIEGGLGGSGTQWFGLFGGYGVWAWGVAYAGCGHRA